MHVETKCFRPILCTDLICVFAEVKHRWCLKLARVTPRPKLTRYFDVLEHHSATPTSGSA